VPVPILAEYNQNRRLMQDTLSERLARRWLIVGRWIALVGLAAVALAACGSASQATPGPTATLPAVGATLSGSPAETPVPSSATPADTLGAMLAASAAATIVPTGSQVLAEVQLFNGIAQGYTADGFPYLGNSEAPISLHDYSDFL
jgi:hypothetical protein